MKNKKDFLGLDNKAQVPVTDLVGAFLRILESQKWIIPIVFLLALLVLSFQVEVAGMKISLASIINALLQPLLGAAGINFDFRLFVVLCFLGVIVSFIMTKGWGFLGK